MVVRLGDYVKIRTGKLNANASDENGIYPFFTCAREISRINKFAFDCECVLVAGNGELNVKYYDGKFNAYQRTYVIEALNKDVLSTKFLFYFLDKYIEQLRHGAIGGVIKYIKLNHLTDINLLLFDIDTQNKIVAILDKASALVQKRQRTIDLLDELLKSQFVEMFGSLASKTQKYQVKKLKEFEEFITSGSRGWKKYYSDFGGRFIRSFDVQMNCLSDDEIIFVNPPDNQEARRTKVKPKDILLTITGSKIGRVTMIPVDFEDGYVSQHVAIIRVKDIDPMYLSYFLSHQANGQYLILQKQYGQVKPGLNFTQIRDFDITFPPIELQAQFTQIVESVNSSKGKFQDSLNGLQILLDSLIQRAFTGKLKFDILVELNALIEETDLRKPENDLFSIITNEEYLLSLVKRLNNQDFESQSLYDKAKHVVFQLLKEEERLAQVYDEQAKGLKLVVK